MSGLSEQIAHLNMAIDDLTARMQELTGALAEQIAARHSAQNELDAARATHAAAMAQLRETLAATVDDLEETLPYAPEYFRDKWDLGTSLAAARAALGRR